MYNVPYNVPGTMFQVQCTGNDNSACTERQCNQHPFTSTQDSYFYPE